MKFGYTIIYVEDVEKTVAFYEKAFCLRTDFMEETKNYAQMVTGETALAFANEEFASKMNGIEFKPNRSNNLPGGWAIILVADDVENVFEHAVKNGAVVVSKPSKKPWGQSVGYVKDCNGCLVEICSPMAAN